MKIILTQERYSSIGNQYQAKLIYENNNEPKIIEDLIKKFKNKLQVSYSLNPTKKGNDTINVINIPKEILTEFITLFLTLKNTSIIVGNKEFNSTNIKNIEEITDLLRINITIKKGKYFNIPDTYYVTFKYVNDFQRELVTYDFNNNLKSIIGGDNDVNNENYLFPFIVDRNGMITYQSTGIIGGTNIPEPTLLFFIKRFINEYDAVITINNIKFRNKDNISDPLQSLTSLNKGKQRKRKVV